MCIPRSGRPPDMPAGGRAWVLRMVRAFSIKETARPCRIFLLNNPHFQKEFQKMMARRQTLFSFSLHFAPILSKLSVDNMSKKRRDSPAFSVERSETAQEIAADFVYYATLRPPCDNKTEVFVHFPRMITPHSFRHVLRPSVKISTIADAERNLATSGRSPPDHSRVRRT